MRTRIAPLATCILVLFVASIVFSQQAARHPVVVGSKKFTESYVLAEIAKKYLTDAGFQVEHKQGMGGTDILWKSLTSGNIDAYAEYTGTIGEVILKQKGLNDLAKIKAALEPMGIETTGELGFNDTYALCMSEDKAQVLGITKISDLLQHTDLRVGISPEFLGRAGDGWKPMSARYALQMSSVTPIEHGLAYTALVSDDIDVTDAYSTDAKIAQLHLRVLQDDLGFFPQYKAIFLYRKQLDAKAVEALRRMEGTIDDRRMTELNSIAESAASYVAGANYYFKTAKTPSTSAPIAEETLAHKLTRWTGRHLELVSISMLLAILIGIPLGIASSRRGLFSSIILGFAGMVQTIPSLALLTILIPLSGFGTGLVTPIAALFLYSLLPIIRNTATGLQDVAPQLKESAAAIGLDPSQQLWRVQMPIASRSILAGIRTSAVINVGTATLAGLIGAGGYGEPIVSGLNLLDYPTILQGAVPAALLALLVQGLFDTLDRVIIPKGLRLGEARS